MDKHMMLILNSLMVLHGFLGAQDWYMEMGICKNRIARQRGGVTTDGLEVT